MSLFTEKEPESVIQEIPESINVPETLMDSGVRTVATTITIPATQTTLLTWSKGKVESAATWLGMFWLRMIKKAFKLGKTVEVKG